MIKKIITIAALCLLTSNFTALADDAYIFTEFQLYTGTLNVCVGAAEKVILFDIAPTDESEPLVDGTRQELPTNNLLYTKDGAKLTPEQCNEEYLDRRVLFLVGKNMYGIKILFVRML